ncbi:MAG: response regulator [Nitrospirae bacterium]|nr:response regulator [Magnetococcales bacterium]HAT48909.1 hypothetical protein [Alphaproteobacteria bacterium]
MNADHEAKSQFLAMMIHELRTPLNSVLGMAGLLEASPLSKKQKHWIQSIHVSGKKLLETINQILDFSKLEAGKIQLQSQPFRLTEMLQNIVGAVSFDTDRHGIELIFDQKNDVPHQFFGDSARLEQILINLVSNAGRYSDRGEIVVSVVLLKQVENKAELRFCVSDQGIGLTAEQIKEIFSPFVQIHSSKHRLHGGTGLGLAICKGIIEGMGGKIWVESLPGQGSSFFFSLELIVDPSEQSHRVAHSEEIPPLNVLLIAKEGTLSRVLGEMIQSMSHQLVTANSFTKALKILKKRRKENPVELIVLDWPEFNGIHLDFPQELIRKAGNRKIPIISLVSSRVLHSEQGKEQPPGIVLVKPVLRPFLNDAILESQGRNVAKSAMSWVSKATRMRMIERLSGAKILLVEDNEMNVDVCQELLRRLNVDVTVVGDGVAAIETLANRRFDGVLMDIQMPRMNGYDATRTIRTDLGLTDLPIIALTANALEVDRNRCLQAGMNDHVSKPIDFIRLFTVMAQWVKPANPVKVADHLPMLFATDEERTPVSLPGIAFDNGLARVGGNLKLYQRLLKNFHKTHQKTSQVLEVLFLRNEHELFKREVHTLRGIAGTIGANDLYDIASHMEHLIDTGRTHEAGDSLEQLRESLSLLIAGLGQYLQRTEENKEALRGNQYPIADVPIEKIEQLRGMAPEVEELLRLGDTRIRNVLKTIEDTFCDYHLPHLSTFSMAVQEYRFIEAKHCFSNLLKQLSEHR